jgi:hypothetical protein
MSSRPSTTCTASRSWKTQSPAGHRVLFYADAKSQFRAVAEEFGFAPLDLGPLQMGRHRVYTAKHPRPPCPAIRPQIIHICAAVSDDRRALTTVHIGG